jgi:hypothetical protein
MKRPPRWAGVPVEGSMLLEEVEAGLETVGDLCNACKLRAAAVAKQLPS